MRREPSLESRSLQSPCLSFPETGRRGESIVPAPKALGAGFTSGAGRMPRPDAAGVWEAAGASSHRRATGDLSLSHLTP